MSRPRSRKASGVASKMPKGSRNRGDTVTSTKTAIIRRASIDTAHSGNSSSKAEEVLTPTRADIPIKKGDVNNNKPPKTTKTTTKTTTTASTASPTNHGDSRPISEVTVPATPALTPALTGTTDDSDTDFQSAYSQTPSPRESLRGNFDPGNVEGSDAFLGAEKKQIPGSLDADIVRQRVSSAATAIIQPSPTFSDDTVVSKHEGAAISRR